MKMQTDLDIAEVVCAECGKPISSIPQWLCGITVKFQCEECRQRHPKVPGMPLRANTVRTHPHEANQSAIERAPSRSISSSRVHGVNIGAITPVRKSGGDGDSVLDTGNLL